MVKFSQIIQHLKVLIYVYLDYGKLRKINNSQLISDN